MFTPPVLDLLRGGTVCKGLFALEPNQALDRLRCSSLIPLHTVCKVAEVLRPVLLACRSQLPRHDAKPVPLRGIRMVCLLCPRRGQHVKQGLDAVLAPRPEGCSEEMEAECLPETRALPTEGADLLMKGPGIITKVMPMALLAHARECLPQGRLQVAYQRGSVGMRRG